MHTHRIKVLYATNDDHVVFKVAHDLQFELFPPNDGFFNQDLVGWAQIQSTLGQLFKLLRVECDSPSGATQGKGRPDDGRVIDFLNNFQGFAEMVGHPTIGGFQSDFPHGLFEKKTIFGNLDSLNLGPN